MYINVRNYVGSPHISQEKIESRGTNVIAKALKPFYIIGPWFAVLQQKDVSKNCFRNIAFWYIRPLLICSVMAVESGIRMWFIENLGIYRFDVTAATNISVYFGRMAAVMTILISLFQSHQIVPFLMDWMEVNHVLLRYDKRIYKFSRKLFLLMLLLVGSFEFCIYNFNSGPITNNTGVIGIVWFSLRAITGLFECGILYFYPFFCSILCKSLQYGFRDINASLRRMTSDDPGSWKSDQEDMFRGLRARHQKLSQLASKTNQMFSPALTIAICSQTILVCFGLKAFVVNIESWSLSGILLQILMLVYCLVRLTPIVVICMTADGLTKEAENGLQFIYSNSNTNLSSENKFQLNLLNSKMANCPVILTASGFATINSRLLAQILGVIVSYCVIMVQQS